MVRFVSLVFIALNFFSTTLSATGADWYSYYIQCAANASQEATCYEAIRDYLSTEDGKRQAQEIGFKRRLFRDSNQVASQVVVIVNRIAQMENYLESAVEKANEEKDAVRAYCLNDKKSQVNALKKAVEEKKTQVLSMIDVTNPELIEADYQVMLSLNSRANELYLQARKCVE